MATPNAQQGSHVSHSQHKKDVKFIDFMIMGEIPYLSSAKNHRACADGYKLCYELIKTIKTRVGLAQPDPDMQFFSFSGFCDHVAKLGLEATDADTSYMKRVCKASDAEPLERAVAGWAAGRIYSELAQKQPAMWGKCIKMNSMVLKISMSEEQRSKMIFGASREMVACGGHFDTLAGYCKQNIQRAGKVAEHPGTESHYLLQKKDTGVIEGGYYQNLPSGRSTVMIHSGCLSTVSTSHYLSLSRRIVGLVCDCCGVSASEATLRKCMICLSKAYCSKDCQTKDWRGGMHKRVCRPPKDFRPGDIVRVSSADMVQDGQRLPGRACELLMAVKGMLGTPELRSWEATRVGCEEVYVCGAGDMDLVAPFEERVDLEEGKEA